MTTLNSLPGRPLVRPLPSMSRITAVRRLSAALVERGHSEASADAIAFAVCDPSAVRRQLEQPSEMRVYNGYLEVIYTSVWAFAALLYPNNPRALPAFAYPVARSSSRRTPLPREVDSPDGFPELVVEASKPDLITVLDAEMTFLATHNPLDDSVAGYGVREPLTLVPVILADGSDSPSAVLTAVDGSSRLSAAYRLLDVEPSEIVTRLAGNSRLLRQRIGDVLALADVDAASLDDGDIARLRALVLPAIVVVGFVPDPGQERSLRTAVESRLGSLHVDPPQQWSAASRNDVQADAVFDALVADEVLDVAEADWLAGRLSWDEAKEAGFPTKEDVRAARLLQLMRDEKRTVNAALRRFSARRRPGPTDRVSIAVEAAMRTYRSELTEQRATTARSTLQAVWSLPMLNAPWRTPLETRSSNAVRQSALTELATNGSAGPQIRELLVLASYWLVRHNLVRKATRGGDEDRRALTDVLELVANSEHGVHLLLRAVTDGRAGRPPRAVNESGQLLRSANDGDVLATEQWIRGVWSKGAPEPDDDEDEEPEVTSPEAELGRRRNHVSNLVNQLKTAVAELQEPRDPAGQPLIHTEGFPDSSAAPLIAALTSVLGKVAFYQEIASTRAEPDGDEEDDDATR